MAIDKYLDLITSQHKTKPKFNAWLSVPLNLVNDNTETTSEIPQKYDVDSAEGAQLNVIGEIVGRSREVDFQPTDGSSPVLDDDHYRLIIKAKIAQNQWDGTLSQAQELWQAVFPQLLLVLIDNQNMTMDSAVVGISTDMEKDLVSNGYIIPKPAGVKVNYTFYADAIFGYDIYNGAFKGYDEGYWFQAMPYFAYDTNNDREKGYDEGVWV